MSDVRQLSPSSLQTLDDLDEKNKEAGGWGGERERERKNIDRKRVMFLNREKQNKRIECERKQILEPRSLILVPPVITSIVTMEKL